MSSVFTLIVRARRRCRAWLALVPLFLALCPLAAAADSVARRSFNLPADEAVKALKLFSEQSGTGVIASTELVKGVRTNAVRGELTAAEALNRMLDGTGLVGSEDRQSGTFAVRKATDAEKNGQRAAPLTASDRPVQNRETAATATAENRTVELSPFTVSADQDVGYLAANTLGGSRLNTALKDTAASISVLTAEFMADIGATTLADALEWATNSQLERSDTFANFGGNTSPNDNGYFASFDEFRVRGLPATVTRNYFTWRMPVDAYNIERVEEQRGPNSVLFGIGSAGGILNTSTKQAITGRSFRRATGSGGSNGTYRGTIDVNQSAFGDRLGLRLNAVYDHSGSDRHFAFSSVRRVHLAAKYNLTSATRLRAEYETGKIHQNIAGPSASYDAMMRWRAAGRPTFAAPIAANANLGINRYGTAARVTYIGNDDLLLNMANQNFGSNTNDILTDPRIADRSINYGGPGQLRDAYFNTVTTILEHQLGKDTFVELAYNHQDSKSKAHQSSSRPLTAEPNQFYPNGARNPHAGGLFFDGNWTQYRTQPRSDDTRATITTGFDGGKWGRYRVAGLAEYEARVTRSGSALEVWEGAPFNATTENSANQVFRRNYVTEGDWGSYYITGPASDGLIKGMRDPVTGRTLTSIWGTSNNQEDDPSYQTSFMVGGQARYWKDRIVVGFGLRHDKLDVTDRRRFRNPATGLNAVDYVNADEYAYKARTKTFGVVGHVTRNISVLYNQSDSISLPNLAIRLLPDGHIGDPPVGKGKDIGLSFDFFDGRLYARATYYTTSIRGGQDSRFSSSSNSPMIISTDILNALVAQNVITSAQAAPHRRTNSGATYDRTSKGYEFSLTANPTKRWRLQANFSYSDGFEENIAPEVEAWREKELPYYKSFDQNITTANTLGPIGAVLAGFENSWTNSKSFEGQALGGNRPYKVNVFTRYTFSNGILKGAYIGGGYRHQSKIQIGRHNINPDSGSFLSPTELADLTKIVGTPVYGNSYWLADAVAGYRFNHVPFFKRLNVQLNVANLFNYDKPLITQIYGDTRHAFGYDDNRRAVNRWALLPLRTWRLSADVEF